MVGAAAVCYGVPVVMKPNQKKPAKKEESHDDEPMDTEEEVMPEISRKKPATKATKVSTKKTTATKRVTRRS